MELDSDPPKCPVCNSADTSLLRIHNIDGAAQHFAPKGRDPGRHRQLCELLSHLWEGREAVQVRRCLECGFGFAFPFIAGTPEFYELVSGCSPHYPRIRWEFPCTIRSLERSTQLRGHLLECGAGNGGFLRLLRSSPAADRFDTLALEYDQGAIAQLRNSGFVAQRRSIVDFASDSRLSGQFAVICAFQTLEHMDDVHEVFAAMKRLCQSDGSIYLSVPNDTVIEVQERFAKHWDMPPNHIGRWNYRAFQEVAGRHGLGIAEYEVEPCVKRQALWGLCWAAIAAQAYDDKTLAGFVNSIAFRPIRGLGKYALAFTQLPSMLGAIPSLCGGTQWVHIRPVSGAPSSGSCAC